MKFYKLKAVENGKYTEFVHFVQKYSVLHNLAI